MVGGRPGRPPGPRGAGGYVSEPHMPVTTATRPYPRITLFFYFYPPSPSRRPARTHARFCTSRPEELKRRNFLKSTSGRPSQRATPPEFPRNISLLNRLHRSIQDAKKYWRRATLSKIWPRESALRASFPLATGSSLQKDARQPHKPSGL